MKRNEFIQKTTLGSLALLSGLNLSIGESITPPDFDLNTPKGKFEPLKLELVDSEIVDGYMSDEVKAWYINSIHNTDQQWLLITLMKSYSSEQELQDALKFLCKELHSLTILGYLGLGTLCNFSTLEMTDGRKICFVVPMVTEKAHFESKEKGITVHALFHSTINNYSNHDQN